MRIVKRFLVLRDGVVELECLSAILGRLQLVACINHGLIFGYTAVRAAFVGRRDRKGTIWLRTLQMIFLFYAGGFPDNPPEEP